MVAATIHIEECADAGEHHRGDQWAALTTTLQANASLVWGHEKTEFEDNQGWQWRAWFEECGKCFKIKAAWGHPDIVS